MKINCVDLWSIESDKRGSFLCLLVAMIGNTVIVDHVISAVKHGRSFLWQQTQSIRNFRSKIQNQWAFYSLSLCCGILSDLTLSFTTSFLL